MSIMAESGYVENETHSDTPPATRDWLHHTNQSLSRLKDVKQTPYQLGGGQHEREVNCQCNYRSKSRNSFLSLGTEPPQLGLDSQETASMPDLSIPEIVKQFNERQKSKQKRRPHSSAVYSTRSTMKKQNREKPSEYNYNAFITVKGQTVTPQVRPPPGSLPITDVKKDDSAYRGLVYLDRQQVQQAQTSALQGFRRYSAAFCGDDEDTESAISPPPPPRASPEPPSPRLNSPELVDSAEESFSEDDDNRDIINKSWETRSLSSEASRSLVFAIPTAGNEGTGSDDEETPSDFNTGRLSADYVAKSEFLLHEISSKSQTETAEISDMLLDMENTQDKISQLRISPRDLDLESTSGATTPSAHLANMQIECAANTAGTEPQHDIGYETFWIEEPPGSYISNALPSRYTRVCSARYLSQHKTSRVRKQQSEGSLVLKGKTVEFFNSEDLAARNRMRDRRRNSIPNDVTEGEHEMLEKRKENTSSASKVVTKPPLPKWNTTKHKKKLTSKHKHGSGADQTSDGSIHYQPSKSSLRKSNSEGDIHLSGLDTHLSPSSNLKQKSVTFSQDVVSQDGKVASCKLTTHASVVDENVSKPALETCSWSCNSGVVIQNGLEMKEVDLQIQEISEIETTEKESKITHTHKTTLSTRAKLLAKMKELPRDEEPCPCRTVTRPTTALLTESRNGKSGTKETSSRNEKLLKHRATRPSSAPIKRSPGNGSELKVEKPRSPRSKPRAMSAKVQRRRTGSEGAQSRPRPSSAHVGKSSSKDARRSRAAAKVLKEGFLFKEKPPPPLPPASRENQQRREEKGRSKQDNNNNNNSLTLPLNKEEEVVASEECHEVFARLQEKGIDVSMDTIKRGLMAPARRASDYHVTGLSSSSGLLSRPENWLTEEHARVQIWENALKNSK